MALTDQDKMILIAVLAIVMIFVLYFEARVMRGKTKDARKASMKKDEAYNSILTTRSVMNVVERQGRDVSAVKEHLSNAKDAMTRGEYESCMRLCDKAKEELTRAKCAPAARSRQPQNEEESQDHLEKFAESILAASKATPSTRGDEYKGTKLSDDKGGNYMSAKFEMNTARSEISRAAAEGRDVFKAERLAQEADSVFASGDYTRALSLALKARKAAGTGAQTEAIPLRATRDENIPEPPPDVEDVEEMETASGRCHRCGAPMHSDDTFCPKCGAKAVKERRCPGCGVEPREGDSFCRKCGSRIP